MCEELVKAASKEELADIDCEPLEASDVMIQVGQRSQGSNHSNWESRGHMSGLTAMSL